MNPSADTPAHTSADATLASPRRVDQLLAHYGASHTHPTNELIHFIAIPAIALSLLGLIYALHPWLAYGFVAASLVYYVRLSGVFFVPMLLLSALMLFAVESMNEARVALCVSIFVAAWVVQFIGHKLEGKKPSFFEDLQYLWVGPLFVLSKLFLRLGVRW
jgi:uncharacterized membrane protein YGL010W